MKNAFLFLLITLILSACVTKELTHKEVATNYFQARNAMKFEDIQQLIADSITVIEGDYTMPYSQESYYEVFKWDSVFQTSYEIVDVQEDNDVVVAAIRLSSSRMDFLQNNGMTCQFKLSFKDRKISKIESLDCKDANWKIWEERVNTLVGWVDANHPELNGFIYDMTMDGAHNYLKAIALYTSSINDPK